MALFDEMPGVEFEKVCQNLLIKMGLEVEMTKASGDGGIDLIALLDKPIVGGKFIVQCKRYTGSIGVPIVRDLYGVVTDERANKGILITTGRFTQSGKDFAKDKNIELIDGKKLLSLLKENGFGEITLRSKGPISFLDNPKFNVNKYRFYHEAVRSGTIDNKMARDYIEHLFGYFIQIPDEDNMQLLNSGFVDAYLRERDQVMKTYFKRVKIEDEVLPGPRATFFDFPKLFNFDLYDYVFSRCRYFTEPIPMEVNESNGETYFDNDDRTYRLNSRRKYTRGNIPNEVRNEILNMLLEKENSERGSYVHWGNAVYRLSKSDEELAANPGICSIEFERHYDFYEFRNLIVLLTLLDIQEGIEIAARTLYGSLPADSQRIWELPLFKEVREQPVFALQARDGSGKYYEAGRTFYDFKPYFNRFYSESRDKIEAEKRKIRAMIEAVA